jgi:hypothetical protein
VLLLTHQEKCLFFFTRFTSIRVIINYFYFKNQQKRRESHSSSDPIRANDFVFDKNLISKSSQIKNLTFLFSLFCLLYVFCYYSKQDQENILKKKQKKDGTLKLNTQLNLRKHSISGSTTP